MEQNDNKNEYRQRINKVQDYIEGHIDESFTLEDLSYIAGFSKYHFHRIFKAITHESLLQYVNRCKFERATQLLAHRHDMSITDIAYQLGFTDSAVFSRRFKQMFEMAPTEYRKQYRKNCKEDYHISRYNSDISDMKKEDINGHVEIVEVKKIKVAYVRFTGNYHQLGIEFPSLLENLITSAYQQNLIDDEQIRVLSVYHDHPEFSDPDDYKTSIAIKVDDEKTVDESQGLCYMEIPAGLYIVGHFYIPQHLYGAIWDYIYEEWLTMSGYVPRDCAPFEMYMNDYRTDENHMHLVNIYLPVEPLSL